MFTNVIKKFKEMSFVGKQPAFTLAEVLIALVVLGVIASTVTGVVYFSRKDMNNKDLVATLQSQVIKLNRSYKIALAENDDLDRWVYKNASDNSVEKMSTATQAKKNELFAKVWESYFPSTKVCGAGTSDTCFPKSTASGQSSVNYNAKSDYYKLRTGDGAAVAIKISDHLCRGTGVNGKDKGVCGEIIIDINGNKGPNKEGLDTYRLGIYHNGIRPFAAGCDNPLNSANVVLTSGETCYEDFNVITCPKDSPHKCHNCDGKIVCVANETACSALQKSGGCAQETCPEGTISYYADGKIQCIPEAQKECYEQIKLNPEYKWDPVTKKCLTPKENCEKNGGYWEDGKEICWDSPEHMCTTKQQVYVPKPNQNPNFECISQEEYCKREVRKDGTGGLGGWLWKNNVCCTATSVASNTNATCCNSYSDIKGGSHTWWDGTSACCTSNNTEACCKSVEDGHEAGFWSNGKCWKDPKTQCENPAPTGLGGIWIASTNSCCTTKIVDNKDNPKYCFASEKDKCNAPSDKGGKGGWYVASADKCCTSETDDQVCCKGIWRSYGGKNYCYENEKAVCVAPTNQAGIGGWWVPEATSGYNTYSGCCTSYGTRACCNGIDKNHWWAASGTTCCTGPIESSKACCESAENGHESKYWTSTPSQCWTSASQFCITPTGSNGLGGWNWIGDAKSGVCCTDTSKATRSNDNGNGNIQHQGQFDRLLTDDYSKRCCINESTLNGHSRFIWYTANYKGNTGYCWDNVNNLCQQQTDSSDDHGLGGWYWDGTDCCSINTKPASISYWTKGNIKSNPPTLESTGNVSVKNESDRSTKSCCTNTNGKGGHTRFNWTDKNYAGKGGYCWFDDEELCQNQTDSGNDFGMGGWYWDKSSNHCCSSKYDVNVNTNNKTQEVFRKGASSEQVKVYNQQNDSNLNCCTNANTKGGHTRFIWTAKAYADTRGYCWLNNDELCQEQTDNSNYNHDAGMGGWLWDSASNSCCTIRTTSAQPINIKGGSASSVAVKNQSSNSNKNCCTNPSKKGGHTRFNWTDKTYSNKGGYCWLDDEELCQAQTGLADYGMGGWYWDSASSTCCTIKYDTSITTAPKTQEVFRSGGFAAQVKVTNQQNASNKACCTNNNTKGGHTRFNWTDKNHAGNGGYCWLDDAELCQAQTDAAGTYGKDFGMSGWAWDSSSNRCCTNKYNTNIKSANSTQTKYVKGGSSEQVKAYNQQNDSNKFCCTNANTKGGHTRFNWTDNNYASSGGYCWNNDEELCQAQTDAAGTYGKDFGMGGWLWDSASNSCCTIKTTSAQTKYVKGGSSASVAIKNQSSNSNKNCCTSTQTKGGHTRFIWTDNNYAGKGGYCWLDDAELCQGQTGLADYGMGGWAWDSSSSTCCTIKTTSAQTKYVKGGSSEKVNVKNQSDSSSKFCCINNNSKGGHTRFNWTDNNYADKGGYCWLDENEICQGQTGSGNDHGMGGWYYDSSTQTCCTAAYNTGAESEPDTQIYFGKNNADHEMEVFVKNETNSSSKACCTNSSTKGGHSRFNWTDNNYAGNGGYCWDSDSELCQNQTGTSKDRGMGGWAWDSSSSTCCTIKTTSAQTKYVKGGSSAKVNIKNQSSTSSKFCCTNSNTKGGHDRFIWTDNNYASKGGYCWKDNAEVCQSQTGLADYGMGGWLWDSTNNVCCTVKTTSAQKIYTKGGTESSIAVKNQSNDSTRQCCTSTQTKGGHKNTLWTSTTSKDNAGYCWLDKAEFCKATISAGLKGWDYDATNDQCCTDNTATDSSYWNGSKYTKLGKKDQAGSSSEYCCTSTSTDGGHTNFNWINGKCWNSNSGFCTDTTANKGAGGWYQDGSNCCTTSKTGTETVKGKGGTTSTITYKNNTDNSTAECCRKRGGNERAYWLNSYCWNTLDEYCTSTNGKGASGYYSYKSGSTNYCCTGAKSGTLSGKNDGNDYTITYKGHVAGEQTTKECCVNAKSGAKTFINDRCWSDLDNYCTTGSSSGGAGGYHQYGDTCCVAGKTATSVSVAGGSSATATSTLYIKNENSTKTCCHNKAGTNWYSTSSETTGTCCSEENSKACCESTQNGHTAGVWAASTNTCCHNDNVSEACCQAMKGSTTAFLAGGKCCASESDSATCCKGFCNNGDAYTYNATTKQCTCVSCENNEYIPKDSNGDVLEAKCCTSANDDNTCCTAANAPGNTAGNFYYATSMCCASENDSAECCSAKYPTKSTAYYNSKCYNFTTSQWLLCAEYDTSKISTVTIFGNTTLANKGCSTLSLNVPVTITSKTVSPNKFGSATVSGTGCSYTAKTADDVYSSNGTVSFTQGTTGNNMCLFTPTTGSCSGWWASESSSLCCTEQNRSECCQSSANPDGAGTWASSGSTCCHSATVSDACCKAKNNSNYYLAGSTCCASENTNSTCCTSTNNPNGKGKWSSSANTCCHSETASDACCKAIKGSSYTLYGNTCSTSDPNACQGWETTDGTCCTEQNTEKCCIADTNPDGKGWWVNTSATTAYNYDPNLELIAINIPNAYRYKGRVLNYTPAPLFAQPAYAAIQDPMNDANMNRGDDNGGDSSSGVTFEFDIYNTTGFNTFTTDQDCGAVSYPQTSLSCNFEKSKKYSVTLRCDDGYNASLTASGCTLTIDNDGGTFADATVQTKSVGSTCNLVGTCTKSSTSGSGSSDSGSGSSTSGSYTCCHDEQVSSACCLGKTDNNYWYNNSCTTVNSGVDIIVEYGSDISSVKVGGTSVSNNVRKRVSSANGTTIVAIPASGKTFSKWTSTNCTITSSTSASTTINVVSSGAKYCVIKPTAVTSETPEQPTCDYVIATSSSGDLSVTDGTTAYYNMIAKKSSSESASYEDLRDESSAAKNSGQMGSSYEYIWRANNSSISNAIATVSAHTGIYLYGAPMKTTYIDTGANVVNKAYIDRDNTDCTVNVERVTSGGLYSAVVANNKSNCASCKVAIKGCTGWLAAESTSKIICCTNASASQACCESEYTGHNAGTWASGTCCLKETESDACCKAIKGSSYKLDKGSCISTSSCTGWETTDGTCCSEQNTQKCCEADTNPDGKGWWVNTSATTAYNYDPNLELIAINIPNAYRYKGRVLNYTPAPLFAQPAYAVQNNILVDDKTAGGGSSGGGTSSGSGSSVSFQFNISDTTGFYKFTTEDTCGDVESPNTSLSCTFSTDNSYAVTLRCKDGYTPSLTTTGSSSGCTLSTGTIDSYHLDTTVTTSTTGASCLLTGTCTKSSSSGSGSSGSYTCCHDEQVSSACCLGKTDNNYWYNNSCTTVNSGIDIIAEYGSDISNVLVAGSYLNNKGKKHLGTATNIPVVAYPASGMSFSKWTSTNCTLESTTSESTKISSANSGAKHCIVKAEAVEAETPEFGGMYATIRLSSTAQDVEYSIATDADFNRNELSTSPILLQRKTPAGSTSASAQPYLYVVYDEANPPSDISITSGNCSLECGSPTNAYGYISPLPLCCANELMSPYQTSEICGYDTARSGVLQTADSGNYAVLNGKTCITTNNYSNKKMVKCLINFEENEQCVVATGTSCSSAIFDTNGNCCTNANSSQACCQGLLGADAKYYDYTTVNGDKGFCLPPYKNGEILGKVTLNVTSTDNSLHGATVYLQDSIGGGEVETTDVGTFYIEDVEVPTYYTDPLYFSFIKGSDFGNSTYSLSTSGSCSMYVDSDFSNDNEKIAHLYMTGTSSSTNTCTVNVKVSASSSTESVQLNTCISNATGANTVGLYDSTGSTLKTSTSTGTCTKGSSTTLATGTYKLKPSLTGTDTNVLMSSTIYLSGACTINGTNNVKVGQSCMSGCDLVLDGRTNSCIIWIASSTAFAGCSACSASSENEWSTGQITVRAANSPVGLSDTAIYVYDSDGAEVLKAVNGETKTATDLDYPAEYTLKHTGTNTGMSNNWVLYSTAAPSSSSYCTLSGFDSNVSGDFKTRTGTISMNGTSSSKNKCYIDFAFYCAANKADCTATGGDSCPDGSGTLKLSSSAPSGCTFTYESSSSRAITTSGISVGGGNIKVACSGYYAPTITGSCCSFTSCSTGTTSNCGLKIGEGSTCTISAESCASGWIGKNGGCCYSDNSENCCTADTQSYSGGTSTHTKGTYVSGTCCISENQSETCCKAIKGSGAIYKASSRLCLGDISSDMDTVGPVTTVSFNVNYTSNIQSVGVASFDFQQDFQQTSDTFPKYKVEKDATGSITFNAQNATIISVNKNCSSGLDIISTTGTGTGLVTLKVKGTCTSNFGCTCTLTANTKEDVGPDITGGESGRLL